MTICSRPSCEPVTKIVTTEIKFIFIENIPFCRRDDDLIVLLVRGGDLSSGAKVISIGEGTSVKSYGTVSSWIVLATCRT